MKTCCLLAVKEISCVQLTSYSDGKCLIYNSERSLSYSSLAIDMPFADTVTLLFEVTDVAQVSPALVTRCGLVHCPDNVVGWKSIFRSWIKGAHAKWDITNRGCVSLFASPGFV